MDFSPDRLESALSASWPALEIITDGGWEARFSRGYSGRSNSLQVVAPADDDDADRRLGAFEALYRARGLPPMVKVTPLTGPALGAALARRGWPVWHDSLVLAAAMEGLATGAQPEGGSVLSVLRPGDPVCLDTQAQLQGYDGAVRAILAQFAALLPEAAAGFVLHAADGRAVASALCVVADGIGVPLNVVTAPDARRRGYGRVLMDGLVDWARGAGAVAIALQVARTNAAALGLYQGMGLAYRYPYHYRRAEG